jgi:hemerythrin-like metal-binding protein
MLMPWSEEKNLGIYTIDRQHREFYRMINALNDAMAVGKGSSVAAHILSRLLPAVRTHFEEEQRALEQINASACGERRRRHFRQLEEMENFLRDKSPDDPSAVIDLLYFMHGLLENHIEEEREVLRVDKPRLQ